jgi:HEAT repeat protein/energy-coupling factor transporter ATP-binding protein EcfA2
MSSLRVYVSSTYQDLKDCRHAIRTALQRMGLDDVAMEAYTAGEERPVDRCVADVRSADIYVGVLAWRYGFVPDGESHSITELEYRAAGDADVPRLMFVLDENAPWPRSAMDKDSSDIEAFREHVLATHTCDLFSSEEDLRAKVAEAIGRFARDRHGVTVGADAAWDAYCGRLVQEYRRLDLEALTPPDRDEHLQIALRDVFVEPDVREDMPDAELPKELLRKLDAAADPTSSELPRELDRHLVEQARDSYRRRPSRGAFDALTAPLARACVLLGDPGAGKSTLARYLALALAERSTSTALAALDGWRPVLIELRDYALNCGEYETFGAYLDYRKRTDGLGIDQATLESHLSGDGRALVVFDGLDEVFDPRLRETVSRRIAGFAAQYPAIRVVVTSRVVGYRQRVFRDAGFVQYTVQDLDRTKIDAFLRGWYELALHDRPAAVEMRRERLTRAINDSAPIRELAGNPLLLTILAIIGKHQELPRERWKVYDHAAGVLVQHWDVNKHLVDEDIDADVIREDDKKELLRKLAIRMQEGSHGFAGNSLLEADLFADIESYLVDRFRYEPAKAKAISTAMVKHLRERNFIFARYGSGVYGFVHRALLEFFSASDIVNRFEKARTLSEDGLVVEVFEKRSEDPAWAEVLRLIAGMVDALVAARLVERLLESTGTHRSSALDGRSLRAVALAAQCIAEIRNVNAAAAAAERTLRAIIELLRSPARSFGADIRESHLEKTVLPAMNAVSAWPGRAAFRDWFVQSGRYATSPPASKLGAQFLAALFPKDEQVRDLLHATARSSIPKQREAALLGLTQAWKGEAIEPVVAGCYDEEAPVRRTSLDLLVTNWPDDERTHDLMRHLSQDVNADVRRRAVEALAQHAAKVDGAWPAVIGALHGDAAQTVRDAAVNALASDTADPREHLLRACDDSAWQVRRSALRLVVARCADEPAVFDRVLAAMRDCDEDVRQTAVELLAGRWPEAAESAVRAAARDTDPDVRRAAVRAMAQRWRDDPEVAEALKLTQTDHHGEVRVAALTARTDPISQAAEYVAILDSIVADDPVADARRAALEVLVAETPESSGTALGHGLADPDPDVRLAALQSLSSVIPQLSAFRPAVLRLCEDTVESVRQQAVEVAARFWGARPEVVKVLHRVSRSQSSQLRRTAVESLASRWPDSADTARVLRRARRDPGDVVRYTAMKAQASLGQDAAAVVASAATDPYVWTRRWAATLLKVDEPGDSSAYREARLRAVIRSGLDDAATAAVRAATDDPDPDVRLAAYEIIGARRAGFPDALALVTKASRDTDAEIRQLGLAALLAAWPDSEQASGARRRGLTDLSGEIRRLALESLSLHEPDAPATRRAMTAAITDSDWSTRRLALDTVSLRWRDAPETRVRLRAALHDPEDSMRQAAIETLRSTWPDDESTFDAVAGCVRDPASTVRLHALRSLAVGWPHDRRVRSLVAAARRDWAADVATAAWELQRQDEDSQVFDDTCAAAGLRHPDVVCRRLGAERLARVPADADVFRVGIRDDSDDVWTRVRFALLCAADERLVGEVLRHADAHPNYQARLVNLQVRAARWPDAAETHDAVRHAVRDIDSVVRGAAFDLLVELSPDTVTSFETGLQSLGDTGWKVRSAALRLLMTCWPDEPGTLDRLVSASRDYSPDNRHAALSALVAGWPRHPATRAALARSEADVTVFVRDFASRMRTQLEPGPRTAGSDRSRALERLQEVDLSVPDDAASRPAVMDLAASPDWWIRAEALRVLARRWPDEPDTDAALTRAADDDAEGVRRFAVRKLVGKHPDAPDTVAMLRRAVRDRTPWNREHAAGLLRLWRTPEAHAGLLEAARDEDLDVHNTAVLGLVTGWSADERTAEALGWAACSSFDWLHDMASARLCLSSAAPPDRASLLAARRVPDLLRLASWWGEDPEVAEFLSEHMARHDILWTLSLAAILARSGADPATTPLLEAAARDACPAVRRIGLEGLTRLDDPAWMSAAASDPDPYLRYILITARNRRDTSPAFSAEIVEALRDHTDTAFASWLFPVAAVRAAAGLLDPATLADAVDGAPYVYRGDADWLRWLVAQSVDRVIATA